MHTIAHARNDIAAAVARSIQRDFQIVLVGAAALLILVAAGEMFQFLIPLRLVLGLTFVLFVPGYCLTVALFPHADDLDSITRGGMSLGLSVAMVPVLALILDWLPWGIRPWPILCGVYGEVAIFMTAAIWRRARLAPQVVYAPNLTLHPWHWWQSLPPEGRRIYKLLAGALLLATLLAGWILLFPSPDAFTTEFYILGKAGLAEDYPREAALGEPLAVTMGIANREQNAHSYRIEVWVTDSWNPDRRTLVAQAGPDTVQPGQSLERSVSWRMPWTGNDQQVELLLFTADSSQPYRQLRLLLNVVPQSTVQ